jgi:hypothetical protein
MARESNAVWAVSQYDADDLRAAGGNYFDREVVVDGIVGRLWTDQEDRNRRAAKCGSGSI